MNYRGFDILPARQTGGKAGKGCNKTSTIQIYDTASGGGDWVQMLKQIRFNVGDNDSLRSAIRKAKGFIDDKLKKPA